MPADDKNEYFNVLINHCLFTDFKFWVFCLCMSINYEHKVGFCTNSVTYGNCVYNNCQCKVYNSLWVKELKCFTNTHRKGNKNRQETILLKDRFNFTKINNAHVMGLHHKD